ncbi:hypothetical protein AVEN_27368-1 [Araneus ventricosus]|uniref:Integrase p58-like C-terminal domain-containing protein n=1 Tax=Araneus ventricosus TaxID=182803 RepID=A0A4Y2IQ08_ARAVE|nr:hypothetical protein AVEN_27368-1 [Araneus ventricosus]
MWAPFERMALDILDPSCNDKGQSVSTGIDGLFYQMARGDPQFQTVKPRPWLKNLFEHGLRYGVPMILHSDQGRRGLSPKLQQNWEGPTIVVQSPNDVIYRVQRSPNAKPKVIHINRLTLNTDHSSSVMRPSRRQSWRGSALQSWKVASSSAGLMVGKRVLQGEAWNDLSDCGTHDLGDKLGDHFMTWRQIWRPWRQ